MFIDISPEDKKITPYQVHKQFTVTFNGGVDTATRLGVMRLSAQSGSLKGNPSFTTTAAANTFVSGGKTTKIYKRPLYEQIRRNFFHFAKGMNDHSINNQPQWVLDRHYLPWGHAGGIAGGMSNAYKLGLRELYPSANVISVPQRLFGEGIRTGSIILDDYSTGVKITIKDDGYGNLYDSAYETNFMSASLTANGSGSAIGIVNYDYGLIILTSNSTGSYANAGNQSSGSTGWNLKFDSTKTLYEHEYTANIKEGSLNNSTNISVSYQRSGSQTIPGSLSLNDMREIVNSPRESAYNTTNGYTATTQTENFATHSFFAPYITTIGLYNDHGDLLAVAKTSRPVRNEPELDLSFIIRFDV